MNELSRYCDLLRAAAPEDFAGWPLYIIDRPVMPPEVWHSPECVGFASPKLSAELQPTLEAAGLWCGVGYAMGVDVAAHATPESLTATVLHEAGHWLSMDLPMGRGSITPELCLAAGWDPTREDMDSFVRSKIPPEEPPRPWTNHDRPFIRACLHLWARWRPWLDMHQLNVAGSSYGLTILPAYRGACDDELIANPTGSIRAILDTPAPLEFDRLFALDTRYET